MPNLARLSLVKCAINSVVCEKKRQLNSVVRRTEKGLAICKSSINNEIKSQWILLSYHKLNIFLNHIEYIPVRHGQACWTGQHLSRGVWNERLSMKQYDPLLTCASPPGGPADTSRAGRGGGRGPGLQPPRSSPHTEPSWRSRAARPSLRGGGWWAGPQARRTSGGEPGARPGGQSKLAASTSSPSGIIITWVSLFSVMLGLANLWQNSSISRSLRVTRLRKIYEQNVMNRFFTFGCLSVRLETLQRAGWTLHRWASYLQT